MNGKEFVSNRSWHNCIHYSGIWMKRPRKFREICHVSLSSD